MSDSYLLAINRPPVPVATFVLFPHAGSHANYFCRWREHLPPQAAVWAVQLPGRMNRSGQTYDHDFALTTCRIADAIEKAAVGEVHLYGHSLGGLLAFGTSLQLQRRQWRQLKSLSVSGCASPARQCFRNPKALNDKELMDRILAYGGIPEELLRDRELLDFFLPAVKADLLLLDHFSLGLDWQDARLDIPIRAYCGQDDKVANRELMSDWKRYTDDAFTLEEFPGSHFFIAGACAELCGRLIDTAALRMTGGQVSRSRAHTRAGRLSARQRYTGRAAHGSDDRLRLLGEGLCEPGLGADESQLQCASRCMCSIVRRKLVEYVLDMHPNRADADPEQHTDLGIGLAHGKPLQDFQLPRGERFDATCHFHVRFRAERGVQVGHGHANNVVVPPAESVLGEGIPRRAGARRIGDAMHGEHLPFRICIHAHNPAHGDVGNLRVNRFPDPQPFLDQAIEGPAPARGGLIQNACRETTSQMPQSAFGLEVDGAVSEHLVRHQTSQFADDIVLRSLDVGVTSVDEVEQQVFVYAVQW